VGCIRGDVDGLADSRDDRFAAEGELDFAVEHGEHLLEVVTVRGWPTTRWYVHVDQRVVAGGVRASDEDRVGVACDCEVDKALVRVRTRVRELPCRVVIWDCSDLL
jgi:hypothetical protein